MMGTNTQELGGLRRASERGHRHSAEPPDERSEEAAIVGDDSGKQHDAGGEAVHVIAVADGADLTGAEHAGEGRPERLVDG